MLLETSNASYTMCFFGCFRPKPQKPSWVHLEPIDDSWKRHMWETEI